MPMPMPRPPRSHRDSWPPTQVRLDPAAMALDNPAKDQPAQNPLSYFLSPSVEDMDVDHDDNDDDMIEFDAGIEDANHPREIVRSVSPSSLEGLSRPLPGGKRSSASPEPDLSDGPSPYEDDSDEEYIRFRPHALGLPFSLRDFAIDGIRAKPRTTAITGGKPSTAAEALLSPAALLGARGRTSGRAHGPGRGPPPRVLPPRQGRRPAHHQLWREPSPDVWSIEEEAEDEGDDRAIRVGADADTGSNAPRSDAGEDEEEPKIANEHIQVPAAKPRKKVRFVLPVRE